MIVEVTGQLEQRRPVPPTSGGDAEGTIVDGDTTSRWNVALESSRNVAAVASS